MGLGPGEPAHLEGEGAETDVLAGAPAGVDAVNFDAGDPELGEGADVCFCDSGFYGAEEPVECVYTGACVDIWERSLFVHVQLEVDVRLLDERR